MKEYNAMEKEFEMLRHDTEALVEVKVDLTPHNPEEQHNFTVYFQGKNPPAALPRFYFDSDDCKITHLSKDWSVTKPMNRPNQKVYFSEAIYSPNDRKLCEFASFEELKK